MDHDLTEEDKGFVEKLGVITFGMFLAMNARPELVEPGKLVRSVAEHGRVREFWSPNVVGATHKNASRPKQYVAYLVDQDTTISSFDASLSWKRDGFAPVCISREGCAKVESLDTHEYAKYPKQKEFWGEEEK
jgi:hypothetical protein